MLRSSNYDSDAHEARQNFKDYTQIEAQSFKDLIIQHMESIEQFIVERARHEQEIHNRLKGEKDCSRIVSEKGNDQGLENQSNTSGNESSGSRNECNDKSTSRDDTDIKPSYDTEPMAEVPYTVEYNVFAVDTQHSEQPESINNTCVVEKVDSNVIPNSLDMCDNEIQINQNDEDELITEYLVNISKRCAFWSLNEDILKITILTTNTPYLSRKIRRIRAYTYQRPQWKQVQYAISREDQYVVLEV
ncbi:hypothetical protein Tco_1126092 [Tanacetum coccineum]